MSDTTPTEYLRALMDASGYSDAKIARMADTNPNVLAAVLAGRRNLGIDLAARLSTALGVDLIEFLQKMQILPNLTTNKTALEYSLLQVTQKMSPAQRKTLLALAKALLTSQIGDSGANEDTKRIESGSQTIELSESGAFDDPRQTARKKDATSSEGKHKADR